MALERLDFAGERLLFLNDKYIDFYIKNDRDDSGASRRYLYLYIA